MKIYGLSRVRDKRGLIVKRDFKNWVNCIHPNSGGGFETMWVLVIEIYGNSEQKISTGNGDGIAEESR